MTAGHGRLQFWDVSEIAGGFYDMLFNITEMMAVLDLIRRIVTLP